MFSDEAIKIVFAQKTVAAASSKTLAAITLSPLSIGSPFSGRHCQHRRGEEPDLWLEFFNKK
jgi:hypothetical protein